MESSGAVDKALEILFHLNAEPSGAGVTAIGRALGIPKSSAHRLLGALARRGLVERDAGGCYRPGTGLVALGRGVLEREPPVAAGRPLPDAEAAALPEGGGPEARGGRVWIDGAIVPVAEAKVPVTDHGLLYGDGVFEGIRVFAGRVFRLDDHLARLAAGARALALEIPGGLAHVRRVVLETVGAHGAPEAYVRLIVTRGEGALGVDPTSCGAPRLVCLVDQVTIYPAEKRARGIELVTASLRRPPADVLDPRVKSLNYLNSALAKLEARQRGADEALLLNQAGNVAEASVANLFVCREGVLATPPASDGALEGITRRTVLELARGLGIPAGERTLGRQDLFAADEVFLTGSGAGLVPVRSLDGRVLGEGKPGPVTAKLHAAFLEAAPGLGVPVPAADGAKPGR